MKHWKKNYFNGDLFLYYISLKLLLSHLFRIVVFFLLNHDFFLNFRKSLLQLPLNIRSLRTFVKYHMFKNIC